MSSLQKLNIENILSNYNIGKLISYEKSNFGVSNENYILKTTSGKYILRKYAFHKTFSNVNFEIKFLNYLKNKNFSYKIPFPIKSKDGKYLLKINKSLFYIYRFIEGETINRKLEKKHLKQLAKVMSYLHNLIEKSNLNNSKGKGSVFNKAPVLKELNEFRKLILKKPAKDKKDNIFLKESEILISILKSLDCNEYLKYKKYPLHRDINQENIIFKKDKLVGIIDFENVSVINDTFIKDISVTIQYCCRDNREYKIDLNLAKYFLEEYNKYRKLSKIDISLIPDIISAGSIEDFSYVYWLFLNDRKRAKLYRLKLYSKTAQWYNKNKEKIISTLLG
ncbi:MAG: phosphotransferase [archaeon]